MSDSFYTPLSLKALRVSPVELVAYHMAVRMRNITLGKTTIKVENITLSIFDRERTIVDAFRYLERETALKALKIALTKKGDEKINIEKIRQYAKN